MNSDMTIDGQSLTNESFEKFKQIKTQLESSLHEHKKALLQAKSELQYERNRGNEFEEKYKNAIRYQNEEKELKKLMTELNEKLRIKQNQTLELLKSQHQKKLRISELESDYEQLQTSTDEIQQKLKQIQEGAVSAIMEKDAVINELEQKLHLIQEHQSTNSSNLSVALMELEQKYKMLEEGSQAVKQELQNELDQRIQQLRQLEERSEHQKEKLQERIARLQQQIQDYEKHIEHINEEKNQEENLEEKYYLLQEKLRKSQKRNSEVELLLSDVKKQYEQFLAKFTHQEEQYKNLLQQIKSLKLKIKELHSQVKDKQKQNHEIKLQHEKVVNQLNKKLNSLQNDRKKSHEVVDSKNIEIQRLRVEVQQKIAELLQEKNRQTVNNAVTVVTESRASLAAQIKNVNAQKFVSPVKMVKKQSEEQSRLIEKFKHQISDLEQNNSLLNKKLQEKTKQLQQLRQRLVSESGSASRSEEEAKLLCVIEDLNNHIKKLENSMITEKYKYAEDENFWKMKEKNYKVELDNLTKQFKKERSQLLERIDRMKKSVSGKDKKMDYYQSAFK